MDSVLKGNTGEFYVLAELSRRDWIAAQTARNSRAYDVLARKGDRQVGLRVKTKTSGGFQWNVKKNGEIFLELGAADFCVLVEIPAGEQYPLFYVVPTRTVRDWLTNDFKNWVETPGAKGQQHDRSTKRRIFHLDGDETKLGRGYRKKLSGFLGNWKLLDGDGEDSVRKAPKDKSTQARVIT
ncbi:MAG: hypothetical protein WB760_17060 [Xanthobacteraceae bacterium]